MLRARIEAGYDDMTQEEQGQYNEEHQDDCDGHEHVYFESHAFAFDRVNVEATTSDLFITEYTKAILEKRQADLSPFLDWWFVHDTNDNFVSTFGIVPDKYFNEQYIGDRNEAEGEQLADTFEAEECYHPHE